MGKVKQDSEDQGMDIEQPQAPAKKKKAIVKKSKPQSAMRPQSQPARLGSSLVREVAKSVNLKSKHKSLEQKQAIFSKIVKGLQQKSELSKKDKKKSRVLLKKELRKHLQEERVHARKKSGEFEQGSNKTQVTQMKNPQKFKKKEINQRAKAAQFHSLMGTGLSKIRDMIAKKTFSNQARSSMN